MGWAKERQIIEWQEGWKFVDEDLFVCPKCFDDYAIQDHIKATAEAMKCSYCKRRSKKPIAAPMNSVLALIGDGIRAEYGHPDNEGMPVEGGQYVFPTMWTEEVLWEVGNPVVSEAVMKEINDSFGDSIWVQKPFLSLDEDDELRYGWKDFVKTVKHRTRYVFLRPRRRKKRFALSENIPPSKMLDRIGKVIDEVGLVHKLDAGSCWFRARVHGMDTTLTTAAQLGTVPQSKARFPNRMSPAGIPMFYGSGDESTVFAETYQPRPHESQAVTVGVFETARDMWVLDLTNLPHVPSLFDEGARHLRCAISFLRHFVGDLTEPIAKDGREHIDYVPTQVVTEYIRHVFVPQGGLRIRGILYRSARRPEGVCCVLFFTKKHCCDAAQGWQQDKRKWLGLVETARHEFPALATSEPA